MWRRVMNRSVFGGSKRAQAASEKHWSGCARALPGRWNDGSSKRFTVVSSAPWPLVETPPSVPVFSRLKGSAPDCLLSYLQCRITLHLNRYFRAGLTVIRYALVTFSSRRVTYKLQACNSEKIVNCKISAESNGYVINPSSIGLLTAIFFIFNFVSCAAFVMNRRIAMPSKRLQRAAHRPFASEASRRAGPSAPRAVLATDWWAVS